MRDQTGAPVAGAQVRAFGANGGQLGQGVSDLAGTFAVAVSAPAKDLEVTCRWCASTHFAVGDGPVVAIVRRYAALVGGLTQRDLFALPYDRPGDAAGLLPYVVPVAGAAQYPSSVSDRGLDRGRGLILDEGSAAYDLTGYSNGLGAYPDRSLQSIDFEPAERAFAYGSYAGGGTFALSSSGDAGQLLDAASGSGASAAGYGRLGGVVPEFALSRNDLDGTARKRANVDADVPFAGGELSATLGSSGLRNFGMPPAPVGSTNHATLRYATRSRRYRTFATVAGFNDHTAVPGPAGDINATGGTLVSSFRLEHPATISTALEFVDERLTGAFAIAGTPLAGRAVQDGVILEAQGGDARTSYNLDANLSQIGVRTWESGYESRSSAVLFLPSLALQTALPDGFGVHLSASQSLRIPTLYESYAGRALPAAVPAEVGSLFDGGLTYDDASRIRIEAMVFREDLADLAPRGTNGVGLSLAWQVAPLLSLRAWTLNDSGYQNQTLASALYGSPSLARGVAWLTYENPSALRFDAIVQRDRTGTGAPVSDLDGSASVPLSRTVTATVGTLRRDARRRFYGGLRFTR